MIWDIVTGFLPDVWGWAIGILGVLGGGLWLRQSGKRSERQKGQINDHERAGEIRDRNRNDLDQRVRDYDDSGWRD